MVLGRYYFFRLSQVKIANDATNDAANIPIVTMSLAFV